MAADTPSLLSVSAADAALFNTAVKDYGSPLYVYDLDVIRRKCEMLKASVPSGNTTLLYAMKANSNVDVLKTVLSQGFGVDCVSLGELLLALRLGASKILFTNNNISATEYKRVITLMVENPDKIWINCDSIQRLGELPRGSQCFIRVNGPVGGEKDHMFIPPYHLPCVTLGHAGGHHHHVITCGPDSKFGIPHEFIPQAIKVAQDAGVQIIGLHQHIGSGVLDPEKFAAAIEVLASVLKAHSDALPHVKFINFGGGIGVPYRPTQTPIDLAAFGNLLKEKMAELRSVVDRPDLGLVLEPGRFPVAESGYLLTTVNTIKPTPYNRTYVGVDTGFNHLVRPCMYGSYHHISNITSRSEDKAAYIVAGNICESGDVMTRGTYADLRALKEEIADAQLPEVSDTSEENIPVPRALPITSVGDILAFHTAGAYGYSMASEYNTRPRPAEVIIETSGHLRNVKLSRKARTFESMVEDALAGRA